MSLTNHDAVVWQSHSSIVFGRCMIPHYLRPQSVSQIDQTDRLMKDLAALDRLTLVRPTQCNRGFVRGQIGGMAAAGVGAPSVNLRRYTLHTQGASQMHR